MKQRSLIRTIYLYLFTIVGLALLVVGSVRFLDMALKAFVFTKAEAPEKLQQGFYCQQAPVPVSRLELMKESQDFSEDEQKTIKNWLAEYKICQEQGAKISYLTSRRQTDASINLAMILVGLPLYLYHWLTIKKETEER